MTKRADKLLQKANVYEKIALFGNRQNFLAAIAQEVRLTFPPAEVADSLKPVEAKLQSVVRKVLEQLPQSNQDINNLQTAANTLGNLMQPAYVTTLLDLKGKVDALSTQLKNIKSSSYSIAQMPEIQNDMRLYLTQLAGEASSSYNLMLKDPNVAKVVQTQTNMPVAQDTTKSEKTKYPTLSTKEQEALSRIYVTEGLGLPLKIDGVLGPETQKAIDALKKKWNVPNYSNQQILTWVDTQADSEKYK